MTKKGFADELAEEVKRSFKLDDGDEVTVAISLATIYDKETLKKAYQLSDNVLDFIYERIGDRFHYRRLS